MKKFPQRILNSTDFNIDKYHKCFLSTKSAYWTISEGTCDTKDWSNGCWKFSFASQEKKKNTAVLNYNNIHNITVFQSFGLNACSLVEHESNARMNQVIWFKNVVLTVVGIVSDDVVPSAPVPQQKGCISWARDNVAITSNVGLGSCKTSHHIPVTKHDLSEFPWMKSEQMTICAHRHFICTSWYTNGITSQKTQAPVSVE